MAPMGFGIVRLELEGNASDHGNRDYLPLLKPGRWKIFRIELSRSHFPSDRRSRRGIRRRARAQTRTSVDASLLIGKSWEGHIPDNLHGSYPFKVFNRKFPEHYGPRP